MNCDSKGEPGSAGGLDRSGRDGTSGWEHLRLSQRCTLNLKKPHAIRSYVSAAHPDGVRCITGTPTAAHPARLPSLTEALLDLCSQAS